MDRNDPNTTVPNAEQVGSDFGQDRSYGSLEEALSDLADVDMPDVEQPTDGQPDPVGDQAEDDLGEDLLEDDEDDDAVAEDGDEEAEEDSDADPWEAEIEYPDGTRMTLREAHDQRMFQADYTQKTQALAQEREQIQETAQRYQTGAQSLLSLYQNAYEFLQGLVPPEPPLSLAQQDPAAYQYHKALRESAQRELEGFQAGMGQAQQQVQQMSAADMAAMRQGEEKKLIQRLPALKDPGKLSAFHEANKKFLLEFGFDAQQIDGVMDARLHDLAYKARIGARALENRTNAKRRLAETPRKGDKPRRAPSRRDPNKTAMRRLAQTGSIQDALKIDF